MIVTKHILIFICLYCRCFINFWKRKASCYTIFWVNLNLILAYSSASPIKMWKIYWQFFYNVLLIQRQTYAKNMPLLIVWMHRTYISIYMRMKIYLFEQFVRSIGENKWENVRSIIFPHSCVETKKEIIHFIFCGICRARHLYFRSQGHFEFIKQWHTVRKKRTKLWPSASFTRFDISWVLALKKKKKWKLQ